MSDLISRLEESLTDERITALIGDPALIETHEMALEVIGCLDSEIANIQAQVDAAAIEANARPLSPERQDWLRRACYAAAMRKNERHQIMQRDKEIRGTKAKANTELKMAKAETSALKQQRLMAEAEARREAKKLANSIQCRFFNAAKKMLPKEKFQEILQVAELSK